jgi:hydrogenase maturation protease
MPALLIGIGHPYRRDDGIGPAVAEAVRALALPGVEVLCHHGEGTDLMERWRGYRSVVLVDALSGGGEPGRVAVWENGATLPVGPFVAGSHVFGVVQAVELARLLGLLPARLGVVGVVGTDFSAGEELTPAVTAAIPLAVAAARRLLEMP